MFLARCINSAFSDSGLLLGEYYLIEPSGDLSNGIHIVVRVLSLSDDELVPENFVCFVENIFTESKQFSSTVERRTPVYFGASHRFETVGTRSQVEAMYHKAKERQAYISGSYREGQK